MNLQHTHPYMLCIWILIHEGCHANGHNASLKANQSEKEKYVKMLLINPHPLIISRAIYERHDYPLCVQSRLKRILEVGFNHNLSYYERGYQKQTRGRRWFCNTFYHVKHVGTVLLFGASAFTESHHVDPRVSGTYIVRFASEICFVAAKHTPRGNAACLLWRLSRARRHERITCREAFNIYCSNYVGHQVVYTRETCATRSAVRRPNAVE
uniref:Lipocalin n=1 Tax=Rhipicephalus appendiculatus TaxID=34631 RepID=A0A131Z394_RHIAP